MNANRSRLFSASAMALGVAIFLSGCATAYFTDGFGVGASTAKPTPSASATPQASTTPTPTPSPTPVIQRWSECPRIVADLNQNPSDPAKYRQIPAADFPVPQIGTAVLQRACLIGVIRNGEPREWAVLPGSPTTAATIKGNLLNAGFKTSQAADYLSHPATAQGAVVSAFATGAGVDTFLLDTKAFTRISQPLVFVLAYVLP